MPNTVIAVDVGGTKISAGLITAKGTFLSKAKIPTEAAQGKNVVLANVIKAIEAVMPGAGGTGRARNQSAKTIKAIGIGIAGLTDHKKGAFLGGPNLPADLKNVPLAAHIRKYFKKPVTLDNDVHCFTLGESKFGAAKRFYAAKTHSIVGLTLGTGIGGGIVINGHIYRGRNNAAGEIGHMSLSLSSDIHCSCGKTGHFEAYGSGSAMHTLYHMATKKDLSPIQVEELAKNGDITALNVVHQMTEGIVHGLANVIHVMNPDIVVVGGSLAHVDILWNSVEKGVQNALAFPQLITTPIKRSKLGGDANLLGAALITQKL